MSANAVTIREHVRDVLLAARPGGLTMAALGGAIAGPWRSGPHHRPCKPEWVRDLRDLAEPDTAFFFKQWGGRTPKAGGRELDGRTWDEMPARSKTL